jgi:hypothetical protein
MTSARILLHRVLGSLHFSRSLRGSSGELHEEKEMELRDVCRRWWLCIGKWHLCPEREILVEFCSEAFLLFGFLVVCDWRREIDDVAMNV